MRIKIIETKVNPNTANFTVETQISDFENFSWGVCANTSGTLHLPEDHQLGDPRILGGSLVSHRRGSLRLPEAGYLENLAFPE